ncbi:hypothetical protein KSS87_018432, partial [Heliosperma pusillum]
LVCLTKSYCKTWIFLLFVSGVVLGENFIVTQILSLLKNFLHSCIDASYLYKPEPVQSSNSLALVDGFRALDGLTAFLQKKVIVKKLLEHGQHSVIPQPLYAADQRSINMSMLSSIAILPFSRLFLVGTDDGQLKICC